MRVACLCYRYMEQGIVHAISDDHRRWIRRRISQLQRTQKPDGRENPRVLRGHLRGDSKRYCRHEVPGLRTRGDRLSTKLPSHAEPTFNAVY